MADDETDGTDQTQLPLGYIPIQNIIEKPKFSSHRQFNHFCKDNLSDTLANLRNSYAETEKTERNNSQP